MFRSFRSPTLFADTNRDEFNRANEVGRDIGYDDASSDEQEREREVLCENIRKRKNAADICADSFIINFQVV